MKQNNLLNQSGKVLQRALVEQKRVAQLVIQKDLELSKINDQLDRQVDQLEVFQEMANKIRKISSTKNALSTIVRVMVLDLHFSAAIVLLGDSVFKVGSKYSYKKIDEEELVNHNLLDHIIRQDSAYVVKDLKKAQSEDLDLGQLLSLTSFCVIPLKTRKIFFGLFICGIEDPYQKLSKIDLEFLSIVSSFIAYTLESLEAEERQRHIDQMKSEFIFIASHQLRTPLSVIRWTLKMCLDGDLGKMTQIQRKFLKKTYQSNQQMIDLINDLLDVSRIEEGKFEYNFIKLDVSRLLINLIKQFNVFIDKKKLKVKTNFTSNSGIIIQGDESRISLVFNNLIDNAIKFTPSKGRIDIKILKEKNWIKMVVQDNGIGIREEDQKKLFTKFFRADEAKRMQTEGTGLGLFIIKNIIKAHYGRVTVKSKIGKGSVFTCWLPRI